MPQTVDPIQRATNLSVMNFCLRTIKHFSLIKQQLDPSHIELQKLQLIETWEYRKTVNGLDYIITYYPGQKFFYDQKQKDARRDLAAQIETGKPEVPAEPPQLPFIDRYPDDLIRHPKYMRRPQK